MGDLLKFAPWIILILGGGWFILGSKFKMMDKIRGVLHDKDQENFEKELKDIEAEKGEVVIKLKNLSAETTEVKKEIKQIVTEASDKINKVAAQNTMAEVDSSADEGWDNL